MFYLCSSYFRYQLIRLDMLVITDGFLSYLSHLHPASIVQVLLNSSPEQIWSGSGIPYFQKELAVFLFFMLQRTGIVRFWTRGDGSDPIDSDQFVKNEEMELKKVQKDETAETKLHNQHKSYFYFRLNNFHTVLS